LPDESGAAARAAMIDVDRFFHLLREADPDHAHFFSLIG
jgi:hypothetical protein